MIKGATELTKAEFDAKSKEPLSEIYTKITTNIGIFATREDIIRNKTVYFINNDKVTEDEFNGMFAQANIKSILTCYTPKDRNKKAFYKEETGNKVDYFMF